MAVGLAIVVVIALLALLYGESHYRNCLLKADAEHPPTSAYVLKQSNPFGIAGQGQGPATSHSIPEERRSPFQGDQRLFAASLLVWAARSFLRLALPFQVN